MKISLATSQTATEVKCPNAEIPTECDDCRAETPLSGEPPIVLNTRDLFGDNHEIFIDHEGERYRLRITRKGRLILCK